MYKNPSGKYRVIDGRTNMVMRACPIRLYLEPAELAEHALQAEKAKEPLTRKLFLQMLIAELGTHQKAAMDYYDPKNTKKITL